MFVTYIGDHDPRHVHVYQESRVARRVRRRTVRGDGRIWVMVEVEASVGGHTVAVSRKALVVVAAIFMAVVVTSCQQNRGVAVGKTTGTTAPSESRTTSGSRNKAKARAEAMRLLGLVVMPSGSIRLTAAPTSLSEPVMGTPDTASLLDDTAYWKVPMSMSAALTWFGNHHPGGFPQSGSGSLSQGTTTISGVSFDAPSSSAWTGASVEIGVAPTGSNTSVVRADGIALWIDPVPVPDSQRGPRMRITVTSGCSPSDKGFVGVTNPPPPLDSSLLPSGPPAGGLACQYYGLNGHPFALKQTTVMDAAAAIAFAENVGRLPLGHLAGGVVSCPSDDGSAIVVALGYPDGRAIDLWIATTGCSHTSNGYVTASGAPPI